MDLLDKSIYLLPLYIATILTLLFAFKSLKRRSFSIIKSYKLIFKRIIPRKGWIYDFYKKHFKAFWKFEFEDYIVIKILLFGLSLSTVILITITDINIQTERIMESKNYKVSIMLGDNSNVSNEEAFIQEKKYTNMAIKLIDKKTYFKKEKEEHIRFIDNLIIEKDEELFLNRNLLIERIYSRINDYYTIRMINYRGIFQISLIFSFLPEIFILLRKVFMKAEKDRELTFLKKLIILNGSIKPVHFLEVLEILIEKSKHYKNVLEEIKESNKRNSVNTLNLYKKYMIASTNTEEKLFFEKLSQANNYDFNLAIKNIKNEFNLNRRSKTRLIKKRIELIHIIGVSGIMILVFGWVYYLILPWMIKFDMGGLF